MSEIPQTQYALQIVGADQTRLNTEKPVPELGPTQILCKNNATGNCFSDTKLMHAFTIFLARWYNGAISGYRGVQS